MYRRSTARSVFKSIVSADTPTHALQSGRTELCGAKTEFGKRDFADEYFVKNANLDLQAKWGAVFMGGPRSGANSGAWMTVVFDFGGVRAHDEQLAINPRHFAKWESLQFHLAYKGDAFQIKITKEFVTVLPHWTNMRERAIVVAGARTICAPGISVTIKYRISKVSVSTRKAAQPSFVSPE